MCIRIQSGIRFQNVKLRKNLKNVIFACDVIMGSHDFRCGSLTVFYKCGPKVTFGQLGLDRRRGHISRSTNHPELHVVPNLDKGPNKVLFLLHQLCSSVFAVTPLEIGSSDPKGYRTQ